MTGPIPAAAWLRAYERAWLRSDLVAGLTAAAVVVPQAMAYADIAGLPLAVGLYTALVPLVVYAVMGTSRPLSVTTTSTLAILTAGALHAIAPPGANDSVLISATATLAFLVGGILLVASILRLWIVASFISEPVLVGFKAGVGLVIVVDQVPKLMGVHFDKGHFFHNLVSIVDHLPQASVATILLALAMLSLQIGLQRFLPRVPASLVTVAAGTLASSLAGFNRLGIELVGEVHGGLPAFVLPNISLFPHLWPTAVGIALMSFIETAAAGRAFRGAGRTAAGSKSRTAGTGSDQSYWWSFPEHALGRRHIADSGQPKRGRPEPGCGIGDSGGGRGGVTLPRPSNPSDAPSDTGRSRCRFVRGHDPSARVPRHFANPRHGVQLGDCLAGRGSAAGHVERHRRGRFSVVAGPDVPCQPPARYGPWAKARH